MTVGFLLSYGIWRPVIIMTVGFLLSYIKLLSCYHYITIIKTGYLLSLWQLVTCYHYDNCYHYHIIYKAGDNCYHYHIIYHKLFYQLSLPLSYIIIKTGILLSYCLYHMVQVFLPVIITLHYDNCYTSIIYKAGILLSLP